MNEYEKQEQQVENKNTEARVESELNSHMTMHNISFKYDDEVSPYFQGAPIDDSSDEEDTVAGIRLPKVPIKYLVIDCSPINFIDTVGVKTVKQVT